MKELTNASAYLKGLKDGIAGDMSAENVEKLIDKLITLAGDLAERVEELEERVDYLELIAEDYDDDDDDDDDDDELRFDDDDDFEDFDDEDYDDEDSDLFEIQCTECGEDFTVEYDEIMSNDAIRCPHCGARIELAIDFDDDDEESISF